MLPQPSERPPAPIPESESSPRPPKSPPAPVPRSKMPPMGIPVFPGTVCMLIQYNLISHWLIIVIFNMTTLKFCNWIFLKDFFALDWGYKFLTFVINSVWYDQMSGTCSWTQPLPFPLHHHLQEKATPQNVIFFVKANVCLANHWSFSLSTQNGHTYRSHIFSRMT